MRSTQKRSTKGWVMTWLLAATIVLAAGTDGRCDIYMKQRVTSDASPTDPEVVSEVWITGTGFRSDNPKSSMFMKLDRDTMTVLDHAKKTYTVMPLNIGQMMDEALAEADDEEKAMFQGFMKNMMKMTAAVTPSDEHKKIGNWNCRRYDMTLTTLMGPINQQIWATEDIKIDPKVYERFRSAQNAMMPGMQESLKQVEAEMKKVKGVQVYSSSTSNMMNRTVTTVSELMEYRGTAQAPQDLFTVPAGYREMKR